MPFSPTPQLKSSMFGRMPVGGGKPKGGPAPAGPKGVRIEHRIGIQAPAEAIWDLVYDLAGWGAWNPTYTSVEGRIGLGETLTMTVVLPGMKPQTLKATVLEWVPNEQLHWRATAMGGLLKATRFIEIEQLAEESCIVSNGEIMGGLIGPTVARQIGSKVFRGLRLMNEALKEQAEARGKAGAA